MATSGDWKVVQSRRRRFPSHWTHANPTKEASAKPYVPLAKPTYAQVLSRPSNPPPSSNPISPKSSNSIKTSQPPSPTPPSSPTSFVSPHSPTNLRFPPSASYAEWKGKCFKCCMKGHTRSLCRNKLRCGKCWQLGHVSTRCRYAHSQNQDVGPVKLLQKSRTNEPGKEGPGFDDILAGALLLVPPVLPKDRPFKVACFINRDDEDFQEIERLKQAVILDTHDHDLELLEDTVARYAARTKLVTAQEVMIAILPRGRYLIHLPKRVPIDGFIKATPSDLWDFGFSFRPWSPLEDASITIPSYRLLLGLRGIPLFLWKEKVVMRAVSSIGTYLRTVDPQKTADFREWMVVVATDDLMRVPEYVTMFSGGLEYPVAVRVLKVMPGLIYKPFDFPATPNIYNRPNGSTTSGNSSDEETQPPMEEEIHLSRRVLQEICQGIDISTIPMELRQFLDRTTETELVADQVTQGLVTADPVHQILQRSPAITRITESVDPMRHEAAEAGLTCAATHIPHENTVTEKHKTFMTPSRIRDPCAADKSKAAKSHSAPKLPNKGPIMLDTPIILERGQVSTPQMAPKNQERRFNSGNQIAPQKSRTGPKEMKEAQSQRPIRKLRPSTRSKRPSVFKKTGASKWKMAQGPQASGDLNPEGFFEVHVQYAQCKDLAQRFGVNPEDVLRTVNEDNQQRRKDHESTGGSTSKSHMEDDEDDRIPFRFDLSPGDELDDSDMDV